MEDIKVVEVVEVPSKIGKIVDAIITTISFIVFFGLVGFFVVNTVQDKHLTQQIELNSYVIEDTSLIRVVGRETGIRGASDYFNIIDEDNLLGRFEVSVLRDADLEVPRVGDYVKVNRKRFFDKESNREVRRIYTRDR